jgi:hypothetical protein
LIFTNPHLEKGIRACFSADANERSKGVKWDNKCKEVITVDDEIFDGFEEYESEDEEAQANAKQFIFELSAITGLKLDKNKGSRRRCRVPFFSINVSISQEERF